MFINIIEPKEQNKRNLSALTGVAEKGFWRWKKKYLAFLDDYLYAYRVEPLPNSRLDPQFTYFLCVTGVAISDEAKRTIKSVHFMLEFSLAVKNEPPIQIIGRAPSDDNKKVGVITEISVTSTGASGQVAAGVELKFESDLVKAGLNAEGKIIGKRENQRIVESKYDRYYGRITSGGRGENVFWDFLQGEEMGHIGQYDVNVWFKIRKHFNELKTEGVYQVTPTVKINGILVKDEDIKKPFRPIPLILITKTEQKLDGSTQGKL